MLVDQELRAGISLPDEDLGPNPIKLPRGGPSQVGKWLWVLSSFPDMCQLHWFCLQANLFSVWFGGKFHCFHPKESPWSPSPHKMSISRVTRVIHEKDEKTEAQRG